MQVFYDLPNGARRMCTAYNAYTVVYMLTYIAMMWLYAGLHKLCYPTIRDRSTWSKFGAHGEHGDVLCQAKNAPLAIWLYGVSVVHECRLTLIIWFPWNLNRPRKISS